MSSDIKQIRPVKPGTERKKEQSMKYYFISEEIEVT